jgi:hypothetical protein
MLMAISWRRGILVRACFWKRLRSGWAQSGQTGLNVTGVNCAVTGTAGSVLVNCCCCMPVVTTVAGEVTADVSWWPVCIVVVASWLHAVPVYVVCRLNHQLCYASYDKIHVVNTRSQFARQLNQQQMLLLLQQCSYSFSLCFGRTYSLLLTGMRTDRKDRRGRVLYPPMHSTQHSTVVEYPNQIIWYISIYKNTDPGSGIN